MSVGGTEDVAELPQSHMTTGRLRMSEGEGSKGIVRGQRSGNKRGLGVNSGVIAFVR